MSVQKKNAISSNFLSGYFQSSKILLVMVAFFCLISPGRAEEETLPADPLVSAARNGDITAQLQLGNEYFTGTAARAQNPVLASHWFRQAANCGNAVAMFNLGFCYARGIGVEQDEFAAFNFFKAAISKENIMPAKLLAAQYYLKGIRTKNDDVRLLPDPTQALKLLKELINDGYIAAAVELTPLILNNPDLDLDASTQQKCIAALKQCADEKNDPAAMQLLSDYYFSKNIDDQQMIFYLNKAVQNGNLESCVKLAFCYENGLGVSIDAAKAFELYQKAAAGNLSNALAKMGEYYLYGDQTEQNLPMAIEYFERAANGGNLLGMYQLGRCYLRGIGVEQNYAKAFEYFERSAKSNHAPSQYELGLLYKNGQGIARDDQTAFFWFNLSANNGSSDGMREKGIACFTGCGTPKDRQKGYEILRYLTDQGDFLAEEFLMKQL